VLVADIAASASEHVALRTVRDTTTFCCILSGIERGMVDKEYLSAGLTWVLKANAATIDRNEIAASHQLAFLPLCSLLP
jgi:hypothetical protein